MIQLICLWKMNLWYFCLWKVIILWTEFLLGKYMTMSSFLGGSRNKQFYLHQYATKLKRKSTYVLGSIQEFCKLIHENILRFYLQISQCHFSKDISRISFFWMAGNLKIPIWWASWWLWPVLVAFNLRSTHF